jgi:hypothetical protein
VRSKVEPINWRAEALKTRRFACIEAHLCCRRLSHLITALLMLAQAVPATGRSATGFPGTSAATPRPGPSEHDVPTVAHNLRADLDQLSDRLVSDTISRGTVIAILVACVAHIEPAI